MHMRLMGLVKYRCLKLHFWHAVEECRIRQAEGHQGA
jgi:hypothetical protein